MKILIVTQYFWPESFRINDLAEELLKRGHEVTVLTGKPNYPQGKIYEGYKLFGYKKEKYKGINIIRVPFIPRGNGSGIRLAVNYLSFVIFSCLYVLFNKGNFDISLTFALSPITQVYAALLHKRLYKTRAYIWLQDLWPESVSAAGKMNSKPLHKMLERMVKSIYKKLDGIFVQSTGFFKSIEDKGISRNKIHYIPNWAEDVYTDKENIDDEKYKSIMPEGFIVMFAGNIGEAQDFDSIVKAATLTKSEKTIKWVIVGDGRRREKLKQQVEKEDLSDTVYLLGRYAVEEMPNFFVHADVMLVSLKKEDIFSLTIPSKTQSYMASCKPIVSMLDGIGGEVVKDANCGYSCGSGDYEELAAIIKRMSRADISVLEKLGENGRKYYYDNFSKTKIVEKLLYLMA